MELEALSSVRTGKCGDLARLAAELRDGGLRLLDDVVFLSPVRSGEYGTQHLARILRKVFNPDGEPVKGTPFFTGDPVIATRNDYVDNPKSRTRHPGRRRDVYNSMKGYITRQSDDAVWVTYIVLGDRFEVPYSPAELTYRLDAAYALTVHKMQGDEAPYVVFVNHKSISRNMLYTAVTRASKKLFLLGQGWLEAAQKPVEEPLSKFIFRLKPNVTAHADDDGESLFT